MQLLLLEPGVIQLKVKPKATWGIAQAKKLHKWSMKQSNNGPYTILLNTEHYFTPTKEAMKYVASPKVNKYRVAAAVVTRNNTLRVVSTLFATFYAKEPIRFYSGNKKALPWLRQMLKKQAY